MNLIKILKFNIDSIPIVENQLINCVNTGENYFDLKGKRFYIGNINYLDKDVDKNTKTPTANSIYYAVDTKLLYKYTTTWVNITNDPNLEKILKDNANTNVLIPVTLIKKGKRIAPRTVVDAVFTKEGESITTIIENIQKSTTDNKDTTVTATQNGQTEFIIPYPFTPYDFSKNTMTVTYNDKLIHYIFNSDKTKILIDPPGLPLGDKLVFHFSYTESDQNLNANSINNMRIFMIKPDSPKLGDVVFDLISRKIEQFDGKEWVNIGSGELLLLNNTYVLKAVSNAINIGIDRFDKNTDSILVFKNTTLFTDYTISNDSKQILNPIGNWDGTEDSITFTFLVFKNIPRINDYIDGKLLAPGTVSAEALDPDIILKMGNLNGKTANEEPLTNEKTDLVGMVNEVFENANNGKKLIVDAIGLPSTTVEKYNEICNDIKNHKTRLASICNDLETRNEEIRTTLITNLNNKKVAANNTEKMIDLVKKVNNIKLGQGNAIESDVLKGKTFTNADGILRTGNIDLGNLKPENIKKDVNINGIIGNLTAQSLGGYVKGDIVSPLKMSQPFTTLIATITDISKEGIDGKYHNILTDREKYLWYYNSSNKICVCNLKDLSLINSFDCPQFMKFFGYDSDYNIYIGTRDYNSIQKINSTTGQVMFTINKNWNPDNKLGEPQIVNKRLFVPVRSESSNIDVIYVNIEIYEDGNYISTLNNIDFFSNSYGSSSTWYFRFQVDISYNIYVTQFLIGVGYNRSVLKKFNSSGNKEWQWNSSEYMGYSLKINPFNTNILLGSASNNKGDVRYINLFNSSGVEIYNSRVVYDNSDTITNFSYGYIMNTGKVVLINDHLKRIKLYDNNNNLSYDSISESSSDITICENYDILTCPIPYPQYIKLYRYSQQLL